MKKFLKVATMIVLVSSCGQNSNITIDPLAGTDDKTPVITCTPTVYTFESTGSGNANLSVTSGLLSDHVWSIGATNSMTGSISWSSSGTLTLSSSCPEKIKTLNIAFSRITSFSVLDNMTALEHLDLSTNQLSSLDPAIFSQNKALEFLYLHNNQLTSLDPMPLN